MDGRTGSGIIFVDIQISSGERPSHDPGKGHYWRSKTGREHHFTQESDVDRSADTSGNSRRRCDYFQRRSVEEEQAVALTTNLHFHF